MAIKAFLMQNLSLVALLVLDLLHHKISLRRRERDIKFGYLPPENGFNIKKMSFYDQNRSSRPKVDPHVNFSNFQVEENFSFCKFLGRLDEKRAATTPLIDQFCKNLVRTCLKDKTKSHKVWASYSKRFLIGSCEFDHPGPLSPPSPGLIGLTEIKIWIF